MYFLLLRRQPTWPLVWLCRPPSWICTPPKCIAGPSGHCSDRGALPPTLFPPLQVRALAANNFALMRCDEGTACNGNAGVPRQTLVIKTLQPLAPSARLVQGIFFPDNELRIGIVQPFTQGQLDMPAGGGQSVRRLLELLH